MLFVLKARAREFRQPHAVLLLCSMCFSEGRGLWYVLCVLSMTACNVAAAVVIQCIVHSHPFKCHQRMHNMNTRFMSLYTRPCFKAFYSGLRTTVFVALTDVEQETARLAGFYMLKHQKIFSGQYRAQDMFCNVCQKKTHNPCIHT